jgi:hypothetical protein
VSDAFERLYQPAAHSRHVYDRSTGERGQQIKITNRTGATSVKGSVLEPSDTYDVAVALSPANSFDPVYICAESGVADGSDMWVWCVGSICQVLLQDSTGTTRGYWVKVSDTQAGRADATNAAPPGGTIAALEDHSSELGHTGESKTAGTNVLCLLHFHVN